MAIFLGVTPCEVGVSKSELLVEMFEQNFL